MRFDIFDKRTKTKMLSEEGRYVTGLGDGKIVKINCNKISLMNDNFEILKEATFLKLISDVEMLNENLVIAVEEGTHITLFNFADGNLVCQSSIRSENGDIRCVQKLTNDKFASYSHKDIHIRDCRGDLLLNLSSGELFLQAVSKLSDSLLIAFNSYDGITGISIQIWNFESGALVKEISDCDFVGTCPFGFLTKPHNDSIVLHAYDMNARFIGVILIDTIGSDRIRKVANFGEDLYCFQFENGFSLIKCKFEK
jgi:hypothetical protein